jgi:hypothetical protein
MPSHATCRVCVDRETARGTTLADTDAPERLSLSVAQVAASCLAAISAAVLCSFFGVAGTVIGTAATSIVATVGSAIYGYSLRRTKSRLRRLHQVGAASPPVREVVKTARENLSQTWRMLPARVLAIGAISVFVISIAVITFIELGLGRSLASEFGVSHGGGRGTSLFSTVAPKSRHKSNPTPSSTPSSSNPSPSSHPTSSTPTPLSTPTATRTVTSTPSTTPTTSPTPSGPLASLTSH